MDRIFDIHNHILWGVDDGSESLEMSINMLKIARRSGITDIILTPHNKPHRRNIYTEEIKKQIKILEDRCRQEDIDMRFYPGNEIYYRLDVAERIELGKATTMAGSKYVLLEFNPMDDWDYIRHGADEISMAGYFPIIAHVERYESVMKKLDRAYELVDKGCYLQLNASSVMGALGWGIKGQCKKLLKDGVVSFIASDAHEDRKRIPELDKCISYVSKKYGEDTARRIFEINPTKVIEDKFIR